MAEVAVADSRACPGFGRANLDMTPELRPHGGEDFLAETVRNTGAKARVQSGREDGDSDGFIDRRVDGPSPFAGVGDGPLEFIQLRAFGKGHGSEIEQP